MKNPIGGLNKLFESRVRLGVMSILLVDEWVDYNTLKEYLQVTRLLSALWQSGNFRAYRLK